MDPRSFQVHSIERASFSSPVKLLNSNFVFDSVYTNLYDEINKIYFTLIFFTFFSFSFRRGAEGTNSSGASSLKSEPTD